MGPSVSPPVRVPGSTRRTTSIEMDTSDGLLLVGRARDLVTPMRGDAVVVDEAQFTARVGDYLHGQVIEELEASPAIDSLDEFVGRSASRGYRRELQRLADAQGVVGRGGYQLLPHAPRGAAGRRRAGVGRSGRLPAPRRRPRCGAGLGVLARAQPSRHRARTATGT